MKNLLRELCTKAGVSGAEDRVGEFVAQNLSEYSEVSVMKDGSVLSSLGPKDAKEHILFDAHLDQVGFIVQSIDQEGFLKIAPCGGIDCRILPGSMVIVHGKSDINGIISTTPPHLRGKSEKDTFSPIEELFIDVGMGYEEVCRNISLGDMVSFLKDFNELINDRVSSSATDDRAGIAVLMELMKRLSTKKINTRVTALLCSREELGSIGARTASYGIDATQAIAVDVSFAKQPGISEEKYCNLDEGPMIGIAPSLSREISNCLIRVAKDSNIPFQLEVMGGKSGTDADAISITKSGIPCGLVSIPQRYMHTAVETLSMSDLEKTLELLVEYVRAEGACL